MSSFKRPNDRVAFVTGASQGLGRAIALALAHEAVHVIAAARSRTALNELKNDARDVAGSMTVLALDLRDRGCLQQVKAAIIQEWGRLDVLVANAGILGPVTPLANVADDDWDDVVDTNLSANLRLIRAFDPLLQGSEAGRAVFISSSAAMPSSGCLGPYAVSKAGLEALAKTYALECVDSSVRANVLDPGRMSTAMRAQSFPNEDPSTLPTPMDVAPLAVELCRACEARNGEIIRYRDWSRQHRSRDARSA